MPPYQTHQYTELFRIGGLPCADAAISAIRNGRPIPADQVLSALELAAADQLPDAYVLGCQLQTASELPRTHRMAGVLFLDRVRKTCARAHLKLSANADVPCWYQGIAVRGLEIKLAARIDGDGLARGAGGNIHAIKGHRVGILDDSIVG